MGKHLSSTKKYVLFGLAGLLIIATVGMFTTRRHQRDWWRLSEAPSMPWDGTQTITYRNTLVDWVWHYSGARNVMAPLQIDFVKPLKEPPDFSALIGLLRADGRFNEGDKLVIIDSNSPPVSRGPLPAYSDIVFIQRSGTRKTDHYLVQIDGHVVPF